MSENLSSSDSQHYVYQLVPGILFVDSANTFWLREYPMPH